MRYVCFAECIRVNIFHFARNHVSREVGSTTIAYKASAVFAEQYVA